VNDPFRPWAAAVLVAALAAYAVTIRHALVWDDLLLMRNVAAWFGERGLSGLLTREFVLSTSEHMGYYRPVVLLSLWFDQRLAAVLPVSHHLTNVLLHGLNSVLVLVFLRRPLRSTRAAGAGALLFALHPVHTESVAFVSGRTDLLATLLLLVSAIAWGRGRQAPGAPTANYLAPAFLSFLLAGLSKEVAFMLPAVLLAWDALETRDEPAATWWRRNAPWLAVWAGALAVIAALRWGVAGVPLGRGIAGGAAANPAAMIIAYLRLLVLPWPLNAYYTAAGISPPGVVSLAAAAVVLALCIASAGRGQRRVGLLALAWIALFLLPVLRVVGVNAAVIAERFLYLPSVGVCGLFGHLFDRFALRDGMRLPAFAALAALACAAGAGTVARSLVWRDELTLFRDMVKTSGDSAAVFTNLSIATRERGLLDEAVAHGLRAVQLRPDAADTHIALGAAYIANGRMPEAAAALEKAARIAPDSAEALSNLGIAYMNLGRREEALAAYLAAQRLSPYRPEIPANLGILYYEWGRYAEAVGSLRGAIGLKPDYAMARSLLGVCYAKLGDRQRALEEYRWLQERAPAWAEKLRPAVAP
jgi:tetratricopeptide (TPR) repeat protein